VFWLIANPPQIHTTSLEPTKGIAVKRFVITVEPQKLICPQGRVYPKKAIPAIRIKRIEPVHQTHCLGFFVYLVVKPPSNMHIE